MGNLDKIDIGARITKELFFDVLIKRGIAWLCLSLKLSPVGWVADLISKIVFYYFDKAYPYIVKFVKVSDLKYENYQHQKDYETAALKLRLVFMKYGVDSKEFKDERKIEHDKQTALLMYNIQYK